MHEGKVFINITGSNIGTPLEQATILQQVELWLNNEVAIEAYKKFKIGLRVHLSFSAARSKKPGRKV